MIEYTKSRDDLKAGDSVVLVQGNTFDKILTVERVTKTQVIVGSVRYSKRYGREAGGGSYGKELHAATEAELEATRKGISIARLYCDTRSALDLLELAARGLYNKLPNLGTIEENEKRLSIVRELCEALHQMSAKP